MPRCPLRWAGNRDPPPLDERMSRLPGAGCPRGQLFPDGQWDVSARGQDISCLVLRAPV